MGATHQPAQAPAVTGSYASRPGSLGMRKAQGETPKPIVHYAQSYTAVQVLLPVSVPLHMYTRIHAARAATHRQRRPPPPAAAPNQSSEIVRFSAEAVMLVAAGEARGRQRCGRRRAGGTSAGWPGWPGPGLDRTTGGGGERGEGSSMTGRSPRRPDGS